MSADDGKSVVLKGVTHGVCDYLIKPVRLEALKNIWQHVVRQEKYEFKEVEPSGSDEDGGGDRPQRQPQEGDYSSTGNEWNMRSSKRRKGDEDEAEEKDDTLTPRKPRVVWSVELHQQFVAAVNQLGIDKAVPKKILELMNISGLTRENVASHLQKYRLYLRRLSGQTKQQSGRRKSHISSQEGGFGQMASLSTFEIQALTATGQLPSQSLAALQAAGLSRNTSKPGLHMSTLDQPYYFSFESPSSCFDEARHQKLSNSSKPMNLHHGIPTSLEPKQLANMHQSTQTFRGVNMPVSAQGNQASPLLMQMGRPQSGGQILNEIGTGGRVSGLPLSMAQPILSNGISSGVMTRNMINVGYNAVSQAPTMVDFPLNHATDLAGNYFPPAGNFPGTSNLKADGMFQDMVNSEMKVPQGPAQCYDIFNDMHQHKPENWELQGGLAFDASQQVNPLQDSSPPVMVHQGFSPGLMMGQSSNASSIGHPLFLSGEEFGNLHMQNGDDPLNTLLDSSSRLKAERIHNCEAAIITGNFGQPEDLLNASLKQQEGVGTVEGEFDIDGFPPENIPV